MKATIKNICLVTVASLLSVTAYADIAGNYTCKRVDPSNNTTSYPLTIKSTGSNTYMLEWDDASGFPAIYGVGLMHPSMSNVLGAKFFDAKDSNAFGVE